MKKIIFLSFALMLVMSGLLCTAQTSEKTAQPSTSAKVEAYYFHLTTRCITCTAVEAEAKKDLEALYAGKVTFQSINIEDDANKAIVAKLKIEGQTLLLVKGDKKINLTNEGFLYARTNPEKFKSIIKDKVDRLLK